MLQLAWISLMLAWGCAPAHLRLEYASLSSAAMARKMDYAVYAPPEWDGHRRIPLVLFLHGGGDKVDCFDRAALGEHLDRAYRAGSLPPALIVIPQGGYGFWEDWADGSRSYRSWVLKDLLPHVQDRYAVEPCPEGCHVMGISMGGHGALRFALLEPEYFASVTAISAPIFDTERMLRFRDNSWMRLFVPMKRIWGAAVDPREIERDDLFVQWQEPADLNGVRLGLAWGSEDRTGIMLSSTRFHEHLDRGHIPHEWLVFEGGHNWKAWTPVIEWALRTQVGHDTDPISPESRPTGQNRPTFEAGEVGTNSVE